MLARIKVVGVVPAQLLALMENWLVNCKLDYSNLTIFLQYLVLCHLVLLTNSSAFSFGVLIFLGCMHAHMASGTSNGSDYSAEKMLVCAVETNSEIFVRRNEVNMCPQLNSLELKCTYTV